MFRSLRARGPRTTGTTLRLMSLLPILLAAALPAPLMAHGEMEIDQSRPAAPDGLVEVELIAGTIAVTGWNRNEVRVEGTLGAGTRQLVFDRSDGRTRIQVELEEHGEADGSNLQIQIPAGSRLRVDVIGAEVRVARVDGDIRIETVAGDVTVEGAGGRVLDLSTVSGDIEVDTSARLREGKFKTVVGDLHIEVDIERDARLSLEAVSGDITLALPGRASADFDVSSFSGSIDCALGGHVRRRGDHTPGRELKFATGDGQARVRIETLSGSVDIITR